MDRRPHSLGLILSLALAASAAHAERSPAPSVPAAAQRQPRSEQGERVEQAKRVEQAEQTEQAELPAASARDDGPRRQRDRAAPPTLTEPADDAQPAERATRMAQPPSPLDEALAMAAHEAPPVVVHHHFSDGPRAVPRTRGASFARAQALGIGGHAATRQLLWNRPSAELLLAVPGKAPKSLFWPVAGGTFGRGFGYTRKVRVDLRHNGLDIGAPEGAAVRAAADGLVIYSDNTLTGLGNAVMILHPGGWTTLYGHNQRTTVQPGYYVKRGERIALVGHTGMAWGPHLHFELRDNGRWRDPEPLMAGQRDLALNGPLVDLSAVAPAAAMPEPAKDPRHAPRLSSVDGAKTRAEQRDRSSPRSAR